ncbi:restriction endonuclease subunit S [Larsenimonas suaedae]|uniref:Restriction endonuclease subunit S n=1 Tax=Larsenimonas suaedae TaxID=1851019 RepID=A0ABU1GWI0_9GAMM|nr:restriction endonuclease subunit S [Larsenimonas suaedae]MCM2973292.1 restriction endonuclease subunit S [Larsenimonas suaedae]MDR5896185.1 restriction endonuclease subunit S [Larsenimonas suaedae]
MPFIPAEWVRIKAATGFSQISTTGKKVKTKDCLKVGKFPVIDQGQSAVAGYVDDPNKLITISKPIIVFGDHTRAIKWVDFNFVPGADGTKVLQPDMYLLPRFAYFQMRALEIPDKGYSRHFKFLKELDFAVPPPAEQKVIADTLDTLLAQVDSTKARLERIPEILKRFRQSVLAAAVSGRLTEEWRNSQRLTDWLKTNLGELVDKVEAGKNLKCIEVPPNKNEYGIIKISAVTWGVYDEDQSKTLPDKNQFLETRRIKIGDFLISRANTIELLGNPVIVHKVTRNLMLSDKVLRLQMNDEDKRWVDMFLRSIAGRKEVQDRSTGNQMSMRNIGQKALLQIPIPKPSYEEQTEIVRRVDQLFAYADTVERQVNSALERVNQLTQSILSKAFRGELTAQWRADNPELISGDNSAEALLERIQAERAAQAPKKRTRKKATT